MFYKAQTPLLRFVVDLLWISCTTCCTTNCTTCCTTNPQQISHKSKWSLGLTMPFSLTSLLHTHRIIFNVLKADTISKKPKTVFSYSSRQGQIETRLGSVGYKYALAVCKLCSIKVIFACTVDLLEKSRVTYQMPGLERNYHIMYWLLSGNSPQYAGNYTAA